MQSSLASPANPPCTNVLCNIAKKAISVEIVSSQDKQCRLTSRFLTIHTSEGSDAIPSRFRLICSFGRISFVFGADAQRSPAANPLRRDREIGFTLYQQIMGPMREALGHDTNSSVAIV